MSHRIMSLIVGFGLLFCLSAQATTYVPIAVGDITVIIPIDDPPVAAEDSFIISEDTPTTFDVLANDIDETIALATIEVTRVTKSGSLSVASDGKSILYNPNGNFFGFDDFKYRVLDQHGNVSPEVLVNIEVIGVNDVPVASDISFEAIEDESTNVSVAATDGDNDSLTYYIEQSPMHGAVSFSGSQLVYTPVENYHGPDEFTWYARDAGTQSATAKATINVNPVNDAPYWSYSYATLPSYFELVEDLPKENFVIGHLFTDPDGDLIEITEVSSQYGSVSVNGDGTISYIPNPGFSGIDNWVVYATDGIETTSQLIWAEVTAVNDPPSTRTFSTSVDEDSNYNTIDLSQYISDPDGDTLFVSAASSPDGLTQISGATVSFKPNANFHGLTSVNYTITDGHESANGVFSVNVKSVNDLLIVQDDNYTVKEDEKVIFYPVANDSDNDGKVYYVVNSATDPTKGVLEISGDQFIYTPYEDEFGVDSFTYRATDGSDEQAVGTITINITAVNDEPVFQNIQKRSDSSIQAFQQYQFEPVASDIDSEQLTFTVDNKPSWAQFNTSTGALTGTPYPAHAGEYPNVRISVSDGEHKVSLEPFTISVANAPLVPSMSASESRAIVQHPITLSWTPINNTQATYQLRYSHSANGSGIDVAGTQPEITETSRELGLYHPGIYSYYIAVCGPNRTHCSKQHYGPVSIEVVSAENLQVSNLSVDNSEVLLGEEFTLNWRRPENAPAGTQYLLEIKYPGEGETFRPKTQDGYFGINQLSSTRTIEINYGTHSYRVLACDKVYQVLDQAMLNSGAYRNYCGPSSNEVQVLSSEVNVAPSLTIISPSNSQTFIPRNGDRIRAIAEASDSDGNVVEVKFSLDEQTWHSVTQAPFEHSFNGLSPGTHTLYVVATDDDGDESLTRTVTFTVDELPQAEIEFPNSPREISQSSFTQETSDSYIGTVAGQFRVDESGAATYQVPLSLPSGIAGVTPQLSLGYSTQSGNGPMGIGWSINGRSSITRCRQTYEQDGDSFPINFSDTDRFCLDGQKLIEVANNEYRTEIDSRSRIRAHSVSTNGPEYFTVEKEDGSVSYYGNTDVTGQSRTDAVASAEEGILIWNLTSISDNIAASNSNATNHIIFNYFDWATTTNEYEVVLQSVTYSGNSVLFGYSESDRDDKSSGYMLGSYIKSSVTLDDIKIYNHNNQILREYSFNYDIDSNTKITQLNSITECGRNEFGGTVCSYPTTFSWYPQAQAQFNSATTTLDLGDDNIVQAFPVDANSDGYSDFLVVHNTSGNNYRTSIAYNNKNGSFSNLTSIFSFSNSQTDDYPIKMIPVDIDGDGHLELLYHGNVNGFLKWSYYDFDDFTVETVNGCSNRQYGICYPSSYDYNNHIFNLNISATTTSEKVRLHDANGDAYPDFLYRSQGKSYVAINDREGSFETPKEITLIQPNTRVGLHHRSGVSGRSSSNSGKAIDSLPVDEAILKYNIASKESLKNGNPESIIASTTNCTQNDPCKFQSAARIETIPEEFAVSDFNGDGVGDVVIKMADIYEVYNGLSEWQEMDTYWMAFSLEKDENGDFVYRPVTELADTRGDFDADSKVNLISGDVNSDGLTDTLYIPPGSNSLSVWLSNGTDHVMQRFVSLTLENTEDKLLGLQLTDVNKDGRADIVYFRKAPTAAWRVLYQLGDGSFDSAKSIGSESDFHKDYDSVFLANWDGDTALGNARIEYNDKELHIRLDSDTSSAGYEQPGNILETITNGFGIETHIEYGLMTDSALYTKGTDAEELHFGRCKFDGSGANELAAKCTPVFDLINPAYLVSKVISDAPGYEVDESTETLTYNNSSTLEVEYRYEGMRAQAGGRGMLGFQKVYTYDPQRDVTTETTYRQDFPFIGMPQSTVQYLGTRNDSPANYLSKAENEYAYFILHPDTVNNVQVYAPYLDKSSEIAYALNDEGTNTTKLSKTITDNTYSKVSNNYTRLDTVVVKTLLPDAADSDPLKTVTTTNTYNADTVVTDKWWINRITNSTVQNQLHSGGSGSLDITRNSGFTYNALGLLETEVFQPDSTDVSVKLTKRHCYDDFGNKTHTYTYNSEVEVGDCEVSPGSISIGDSATKVFRYEEVEYDDEGRYPTVTKNALFTNGEVVARNKFGQVVEAVDYVDGNTSNKAKVNFTWYDAFGGQFASATSMGQVQTVKRYLSTNASAQGAPSISETYYFFEKAEVEGGATSFAFYDNMGRKVATAKQGFAANTYIVQTIKYDVFGQPLKQSNPYFSGSTASFTSTSFDKYGRAQEVIAADGTETSITYSDDGLSTTTTVTYNSIHQGSDNTQSKGKTKNILGELVSVTDAAGTIEYFYDANGNLTKVIGVDEQEIITTFDNYGRKTDMSDPDKGSWSYTYNALGEITSQTSAKQITTTFYRDTLGRTVKRTVPSAGEKTLYQFNNMSLAAECFATSSETDCANMSSGKSYQYDEYGRVLSVTTVIPDNMFVQTTTYDEFGRVFQQFDATGDFFGIKFNYNDRGYLVSQEEARYSAKDINDVYYTVEAMDAFGNVTQFKQNGTEIETTRVYEQETGYMKSITVSSDNVTIVANDYKFDALGNLRTRTRSKLTTDATAIINGASQGIQTESFKYDSLNRLTHISANGEGYAEQVAYHANGNIDWKMIGGSKLYYCYASGRPHAVSGLGSSSNCSTNDYVYDANGNMTSGRGRDIAYSHFDKPTEIESPDRSDGRMQAGTTTFAYDTGRSRYKRETETGGEITTTYYAGNVEFIYKDGAFSETRRNLPSAIQTQSANGVVTTRYLHKDHLGSIDTITNEDGKIVQKLYFDAWGKKGEVDTSYWDSSLENMKATTLINILNLTPRGFTGHEHVDHADIIHMNGRIYDPTLGRFLQADPHIQAPENSQSYNRYSYVLNNPLSYTDPSGYFFSKLWKGIKKFASVIVGAALIYFTGGLATSWFAATWYGAATAGAIAGGVGAALNGGNILKGALTGAFSAAAFYGVGTVFQGGDFGSGAYFAKVAAHGTVGGVMSVLQGGKFGHGFAAAGITQAFAKGIDGIAKGTRFSLKRIAAAAIVGGTASKLSGGKFANGATTGAFSRMFNDELHHQANKKGSPITDEQLKLAKDGKFKEFWRSRHDAGDPVAKTALTGWGDPDYVGASLTERLAADHTWSDLEGYISSNDLSVTMEQIGAELALAHAQAVMGDTSGISNLLSPQQVADYHHAVFANHGVPPHIFGGTHSIPGVYVPTGNGWSPAMFDANTYSDMWCKGCDQ